MPEKFTGVRVKLVVESEGVEWTRSIHLPRLPDEQFGRLIGVTLPNVLLGVQETYTHLAEGEEEE